MTGVQTCALPISAQVTFTVVFWVMIIALVGGLTWLIITLLTYNIKYRVRLVTGGANIVFDDRAREVKVKGVVKEWQLLRRRHKVPIPPSEVISPTKKGGLTVEAFYTPEGQYEYAQPAFEVKSIDPLSSDDKTFYASQYKDSLKYKTMDWNSIIMVATSGAVLVTVLVIALIFVKDIVAPANIEIGRAHV